jgi:3-hydroxyisobutyrate dehydrogenase
MKGQKIGFIGLGIMGRSMAKNLLNGGFEVYVYNRNPERIAELLKHGAKACNSPLEMAQHVDTIMMCVTNGEAVEAILFGEEGISQSASEVRYIIDHSTIAPEQAKTFHDNLSTFGITYIDAPVTGGDVGAREGTLTIMVGGREEDYDAIKPILSWVGRKIFHTGDVGSGQLTKCVNQLVIGITVAAMTEGLVFAGQAGLDLEKTMEIISSGAAGSWSISNYAPRLLRGDLNPGFIARDMLKDLRIVQKEADTNGSVLPVLNLVKELYHSLCVSGNSELGNHALIKLYKQLM